LNVILQGEQRQRDDDEGNERCTGHQQFRRGCLQARGVERGPRQYRHKIVAANMRPGR